MVYQDVTARNEDAAVVKAINCNSEEGGWSEDHRNDPDSTCEFELEELDD